MAMSVDSQNNVLLHRLMLEHPRGLSTLDIIKNEGIIRPAARVFDLRAKGFPIRSERVAVLDERGKEVSHYSVYTLEVASHADTAG